MAGAPNLPCPECRERGTAGTARIGNRRGQCATCNRFTQAVTRTAGKRLRELHATEWTLLRMRTELDLYAEVLQQHASLALLSGARPDDVERRL